MCGIVGYVNLAGMPASEQVLRRMSQMLAHRGPDGEGQLVEGSVGLAHRRLAIVDLSPAGRQPMATADGRFILIYNGELFNQLSLRIELEALGRQFHTRTDTEVVLNALAEWGADAIPRFNGLFALALFDRKRETVLLARDRYGIKPLYWTKVGSALLFSSEVKAFLPFPAFRPALDKAALCEYLTFQNFLGSTTLFEGVELLPAGVTMEVSLHGERPCRTRRYWDFDFREPAHPADQAEYTEELERLFRQAVSRQLMSDVPIGAYLSGGIDSGAVTAVAASELLDLKTFTVGFDLSSASGLELSFDERARAERMSYLCGTEHYEMVLKAGDMERAMPSLMWHLEEPRVGQSYPNFYAAKLAGKFGKVVLSGAGGDELFAGYPWRYYRAAANADFEDYVDTYYQFWQRLVPPQDMAALTAPLGPIGYDGRSAFRNVFADRHDGPAGPADYINHSLYFEAKTFLHGLLVVEDKLSMARGLETRVPFLDNDLVDFAQTVPVALKLGNLGAVVTLNENEPGDKTSAYFQRNHDGKLILRKTMSRIVPEAGTGAVKQGFSGPDASWFRGESIDYVKRVLLRPDARVFEFLDRTTVHRLVNEHLSGVENRRLLVWSLLCLEQWIALFLEGTGRP